MKLLLTFGKSDFLAAQKKWGGEVLAVAKAVNGLMDRGGFGYECCATQEVYKVKDEDKQLYTDLAAKTQKWIDMCSEDPQKYEFARHLKFWS